MTTPITTSTTDSQMHNNIMAADSRDRPPMLATGRYAQWRSRFLRYINTRPNGDALRKCILKAQKCGSHYERLHKGESLNIQDVKTNLFWEFGQFNPLTMEKTIDGLTTQRSTRRLNEMIRKQFAQLQRCKSCSILQQLQPNDLNSYRYNRKELAKPITPPSESASEEDSDLEQAQKDKDIQKNLVLIAKWSVVQQSGYSALTARIWSLAKECRRAKSGLETPRITRKKKLLCKQADKVETGDSNVIPDSPDMCDNDIQNDQHDVECDDERAALANLIANLKLDVDDNKKNTKAIKESKCNIDSRVN
ncbi:hypothetical protein Tco_1302602 [Tanacetum coccineum]